MYLFKGIGLFAALFFFSISSCSFDKSNNRQLQVQQMIDSLELVYAPDKRVSLWDIQICSETSGLKLKGNVDNKLAFDAINTVLLASFEDIVNDIILLPEDQGESLVTALAGSSVINLRSKPERSSELVTQVLLGTPLRVLKYSNGWYLIQTPNSYIGWIDHASIVLIGQEQLKEHRNADKVVFNRQYGFSYSEPDAGSQLVGDLVIGCILSVKASEKGFYKISYPDGREAWVKQEELTVFEDILNKNTDEDELVATAMRFMGIPYLWGGTSAKAIDCSGLSSNVYFMNGILLRRDASQQAFYGEDISTVYDYKNFRKGDLLFYGRKASDSLAEKVTHVAIYIGDTEFIHASGANGRVWVNSVDSSRYNFLPGYVDIFVRAKRVIGAVDGRGIERISENAFYKEIIKKAE